MPEQRKQKKSDSKDNSFENDRYVWQEGGDSATLFLAACVAVDVTSAT